MDHILKLLEDGMDFWIKVSSIVLLTGCSVFNLQLIQTDNEILITDEIKDSPFAMQIIEIENEFNEIFLLKDVSNDDQVWFKERKVFLTLNNGKIIKSIGLENDFEIISYEGFKSFTDSTSLLRFKNPESDYLKIYFSYKLLKKGSMNKIVNNEEFDYQLIEESFHVPIINWSGKNYYWIDSENDIWMSKQIIDPFGKKARITVIKKYSD